MNHFLAFIPPVRYMEGAQTQPQTEMNWHENKHVMCVCFGSLYCRYMAISNNGVDDQKYQAGLIISTF